MRELSNLPSPSCQQYDLLSQLPKPTLVQELIKLQKIHEYDTMTIASLQAQIRAMQINRNVSLEAYAQDIEAAHERIAALQGGQNAAI